jgi:hypothetical protein
MGSEQDQMRQLAERIARRVGQKSTQQKAADNASTGELNDELAAMRHSLAELQHRLTKIESHLTPEDRHARVNSGALTTEPPTGTRPAPEASSSAPVTRSPWLSGMYVPATHPSEEKFGVEEATVAELVDFFEGAKKCELEPGGKPCDHCAMCNSRGF